MKKKYQVSLIAITVMLLGAICLATSYALWTVNKTQTGNNIVETGCFEITLSDEQGVINLENAYPITDEASKSLTPYTFKINNTCTVAAKYMINLEVLPTSDLDTKYLAASIDNEEPVRLKNAKSATPTIDDVEVSKTIGTGVVGGGKTKNIAIRIWMDESVTLTDIEAMEKTLNGKIVIIASGAPEPIVPKCIRADLSTLHQEICDHTGEYYCAEDLGSGNTITYGNTTTTEGVLNTGDAFDCDVDGTGYNHRFYYVSDLYTGGEEGSETWDTDTAVLIYYSNVITNGTTVTPDNTTTIAYNPANINYEGPVEAINYMPSKSQWSKMSINENRQIRNERGSTNNVYSGVTYPITFTGYANKAARFLTTQEIINGCELSISQMNVVGTLGVQKCGFLLENTVYTNESRAYSYWLETPATSFSNQVCQVSGNHKTIGSNGAQFSASVRPAIEVEKKYIEY